MPVCRRTADEGLLDVLCNNAMRGYPSCLTSRRRYFAVNFVQAREFVSRRISFCR
jgi:hypothetical protein